MPVRGMRGHFMGLCQTQKNRGQEKDGEAREAVLWEVSQCSHAGTCRKSRGHQEPQSFWQKNSLWCGEVTKMPRTLRRALRVHRFTKHSGHRTETWGSCFWHRNNKILSAFFLPHSLYCQLPQGPSLSPLLTSGPGAP